MSGIPASLYSAETPRALTARLGLVADALPAGGNWYPEEPVLGVLVDLVEELRPAQATVCGSGLSVAVLARALARTGGGTVTVLEHDARALSITRNLLAAIGAQDHAVLIQAELNDYDKHTLWYAPWSVSRVPPGIGLLFVDGPGHFAGRTPRWPAGPELFPRLAPGAAVVLDDAKRVKEQKTLTRWAEDFPQLVPDRRVGSAQILRVRE